MMNHGAPVKSRNRLVVARFLAIAFVLLLPSISSACPTCKDGIADGLNHGGMVQGYFWSIVFMMSMPFLIFGGVAAYFYMQVRKARAEGRYGSPTLTEMDLTSS